ncbi:dihydrolipoamide dehydrogenase [Pseudoroseomonas rhizosphaerae]|uniref:Dihydrolipoamide dehydrogenase n=1 Tax=Teichococcus rhizosphaerae TaxID=1335062 RepID=A0A2C7AEV1_9PROT|nr:FAD-dependent oxidoreductase [Pseudoroseomonas rhizosphaerae]PHK96940.1 dihydrolipoamide dehydrogenase [Pseudoroseomonas rhizosphaerae]
MPDHDVAIIGAGAAGLSVAAIAASLGRSVVLFERDRMGGACLNTGCVPTQALLAAARRAAALRGGARLGVEARDVAVDWPAVRAHVRQAIAQAAPQFSEERLRAQGVTVVRASAHFVAPDRIEAAGRTYGFRRAVIATGRAPLVPDLPGLVNLPWLTGETLLDLEEAPRHLLVLGGGATGAEMAQAHARLGCRVTLIELRPNILADEDAEMRLPVREALRRDGVEVLENTQVVDAERAGDGVALRLDSGALVQGSHLFFAMGHAPRLAALDLAAAGIEATPRGVAVGRDLRSPGNRRVWAAGAVADPEGLGPRGQAHAAALHARVVARGMLHRLPARLEHDALPRIVHTTPELAQLGMTEAEARAAGHAVRVARQPFSGNLRAIAEGETEGQVKLVLDGAGRLLGAGIVGHGAAEVAATLGLMMGRKLPLSALAEAVLPTATRAEAARQAALAFSTPQPAGSLARFWSGLVTRLR